MRRKKLALPYRSEKDVILPRAIRKFDNGKIGPKFLKPSGIRNFVLVDPAATSMRAMVEAAAADGVVISATGTYRPYDRQEQLFLERYTRIPLPGRPTKTWQGHTYWQKPRTAMAATPGHSNHGWGLSVDFATVRKGKTVPLTADELKWLAKHGPSYGWWNTVSSESWHWSYCLGDVLPEIASKTPEN